MKAKFKFTSISLTAIAICFGAILFAGSENQTRKKNSMTNTATAKGDFDISMTPQADERFEAGRMLIDKIYHGDLEGSGKGQMLSIRTEVQGSAAYVAIERFSGTLNGRSGSFALQHVGVMNRGASSLSVSVVPDSGTDELEGVSGEIKIDQSEGKHSYEFTYSFDSKAVDV